MFYLQKYAIIQGVRERNPYEAIGPISRQDVAQERASGFPPNEFWGVSTTDGLHHGTGARPQVWFMIECSGDQDLAVITPQNSVKGVFAETWESDTLETFIDDMTDTTGGGDCEPSVQYILDNYHIEWNKNGGDKNQTKEEWRRVACEEIYFDGLEDNLQKFDDDETCKLYLMWQAASDYVNDLEENGV
jgi:hypothetical protein